MNCPQCNKFMRVLSYEKQIAARPNGTKCFSRFSGSACMCGYRHETTATLDFWKSEAAQGKAILLPEFEVPS